MRVQLGLAGMFVALVFPIAAQSVTSNNDWQVTSPNGSVTLHVRLAESLFYSVSFRGQQVITDSKLGLEFAGSKPNLAPQVKFLNAAERTSDTSWSNPFGKNTPVRDHFNQIELAFAMADGPVRRLDLTFRAYDDGAAFRYRLPSNGQKQSLVLTKEDTEFRFATDPTVWASTYEGFKHPYEHEYPKAKLSSIYSSALIGLPLLVQTTPSTYLAIAEADLTNWAGLYVKRTTASSGTVLAVQLAPRLDGSGLVKTEAPTQSPWRVFMLGSNPGDLIESDLILNLNPPSAIADTSWIRPGKMAWDHWWSGDVKMDNETEKRFIQFAGDMGFPYQLVDWQWYGEFNKPGADITRPAPQLDFPELLRFASEHRVRLWLWLHSGDVNRALTAGTLDEAFTVYQKWGIAGVKIDFMDRDDQDMVNWYATVVALAAKHHLMVDFHGAYKPTGLLRTFPNLLTREGVLGNEYNKFSGRVTPEHKLTLPFTRMLVGPMDYTPGGFLNRSPSEWKQTTPTEVMGSRAQELAMFVVYESSLACVADDPAHYENQPGLEFLRVVPTVWDETRVLDGAVGRHLVIARRRGKDWFLGGMSGDDAYSMKLPLSFLGAGEFTANIFSDPSDPQATYESLRINKVNVRANDSIDINMRPAGGVAIHFRAP
ncbi:MAG: glycoside hydrolase family 97 protein [Bryobacteraceae bacterium]